jgi:hypothetical protein
MTVTNRNRGKHPNDDMNFGTKWRETFIEAVSDLSHLLTRGYGEKTSIELVGNQYKLNSRQRQALSRMSVPDDLVMLRRIKKKTTHDLHNAIIDLDGFNILILLEASLSGAYIFKSRDGFYRDISGVHGSYKRVIQTEEAIELIRKAHTRLGIEQINWYLDAPVSNSGLLKSRLMDYAQKFDLSWRIHVIPDPDSALSHSDNIIITSDGEILDNCKQWFNLMEYLIDQQMINPQIVKSNWSLM